MAAARDPSEAATPIPALPACPTGPSTPISAPAELAKREVVASALASSPADRPLPSVLDAAPEVPKDVGALPPGRSPCRPPWAANPLRIAAPELVPGSTNASILNKASGAKQPMRMSITPGTAVPTAAATESPSLVTTPVVSWIPTPITNAINTGVNAAAWNQRSDFQNQDRPASETSPAAAIGVVAARTSSAPARVSMTSRCPIAARTKNKPMIPRTVATAASVTSLVLNAAHGCHCDQASTPMVARITARVRPPHAASTATA